MKIYQESKKQNNLFTLMIGIGALGITGSFFVSPTNAWVNLLVVNFFFLLIALFGFFMLALSNIVAASFVTPYRKILEALASLIPYLGLSMLTILIGVHSLYEWSHPEVMLNDKILVQKMAWLNFPFFSIRMVICIALWTFMSRYLLAKYREQENFPERAEAIQQKLMGTSAGFMVIFAFSFIVASFDWIMSLEPHWFSTIFWIFTFSGLIVSGLSVLILILIHLQQEGYLLETVNENHFHDLGKLLFGFSTFWAYIWFSQYLLIWYANIPEEGEYYVLREHFGWSWLFWFNFILNWAIPFLLLLPRSSKRNKTVLHRVCWMIIAGQWLNTYLMVAPKVFEHHGIMNPGVSWPELLCFMAYSGLFLLLFFKKLANTSLHAEHSPYWEEGLALDQ